MRVTGLASVGTLLIVFLSTESIAQKVLEPPLLNALRHQRIRVYSTKSTKYSWFEVDIDCQDKTADVKGDIWGWRPISSQETELENGFREACHGFPASGTNWNEQLGKVAIARTCSSTCMKSETVPSSTNYIIKELYCLQRAKIFAEATFYSPSGVNLDSSLRFVNCQQGERVVLMLYSLNSSVKEVKIRYRMQP